jgi:hypothetical protein
MKYNIFKDTTYKMSIIHIISLFILFHYLFTMLNEVSYSKKLVIPSPLPYWSKVFIDFLTSSNNNNNENSLKEYTRLVH